MTRHPTERSSPAHTASTRAVAARRSVWVLSAIAMAGLLTGCARMSANLSPEHFSESQEQFTAVDRHSSYPAIRRNAFESINIIELVDPDREHEIRYSKAFKIAMSRQHSDQQSERDSSYGIRYDLALAAFRERPETPGYSKVAHRNAVQDRIMGVATSRCNVFKTHLRREQADTNFYLGAATTVAGVLGAILPGATASRNLAGTAGIFSGLQAEFNSNYYSNLAAHVIVQGIEQHQARLQTKIIDERQKLSIDAYGMEAAIKDAIYFDGTCSTVVGLLEAAESIKESSNPGLARSAEVIAATRAMHLIANEKDFAGLIKSGELDKLIKQASVKSSPLVVTALAAQAAPLPPTPTSRVQTAQQANVRFQQSVMLAAEGFQANYLKQQKELTEDKRHKDYPKLATALTTKLKEALLPLPATVGLDKCTADLPKRVGAYQMALSQQVLTPANDLKRPEVDAAVHKAAAEALLAADRVEWLLARLQEKVHTLSAALEKTATQAPALDKPLVTPAVTEDEKAFVKQCGAGA